MSLLYDPIKRKPKIWILIVIFLSPFIIAFIIYLTTRDAVERRRMEKKVEETQDIFKDIDNL